LGFNEALVWVLRKHKGGCFCIHFNCVRFPGYKITTKRHVLFKKAIHLGTDLIFGALHRDLNIYRLTAAAGLDFPKGGTAIAQAALNVEKYLGREAFRYSNFYFMDWCRENFQTWVNG
jgi:hypothetical protein